MHITIIFIYSFTVLNILYQTHFEKYLCLICIFVFVFRGNVTLTDLPENLDQLKQNVDENIPCLKGSVKAVALKWGTVLKEFEPFDFLLMADCIYYPEVY